MPTEDSTASDPVNDRVIVVTTADLARQDAAFQTFLETTAYVGEVPLGPDGLALVTADPDDPDDDFDED